MTTKRALYLVGTVVAWLLAAFLLLSLILEIVQLCGPHANDKASGGVGGEIGAVIIFALLIGLLGWLGLVAEHRFRGRAPAHAVSPRAPAHARSPLARHRRRHPIGTIVGIVLLVGIMVAAPPVTVANFVAWERSQETQHHGIRAIAVAQRVKDTQSCGRYGCHWTSAASARLVPAVRGQQTTTIHGSGQFTFHAGGTVAVLVDPHDLAYSELPGYPLHSIFDWAMWLGITIVLWGSLVWIVLARALLGRRRRPSRAAGL